MRNRSNARSPFLAWFLSALFAGLVLIMATRPAAAQVSGVSYTLTPTGERVFWEDDAALEPNFMYGGALGLGFGEYLEVSGQYLLGEDSQTDFSNFSGNEDAALDALANLESRNVDVRRYGGQVRLNLSAGNLAPYATIGAGVIQFDPDELDATKNIYATGGLGLVLSAADRYTLTVGGEYLAYRYNPANAFLSEAELDATGLDRDNFNEQTVYNPALRASLRLYLGGREPGELSELDQALLDQFNGGGVRIFAQPFYGQLNFNEALSGFPDSQPLAGINAGIELGPYVGLRGFYWRTTDEDEVFEDGVPDNFGDLQLFGGELNLRFGGGLGQQSFTPYLILGGGYADILEGYQGTDGMPPESRFFATGGGGVKVPLSSALKLHGGVRSLFMSNQDVEDISDPGNVYGSLMYTAGLEFSLGGGGGTSPEQILERRREAEQEERTAREQETQTEIQRLRARIDSLETARRLEEETEAQDEEVDQLREDVEQLEQRPETPTEAEEPAMQQREAEEAARTRRRPGSNLSGETIRVPIPERGEIYVRFGEGASGGDEVETVYAPPVIQGQRQMRAVRPRRAPRAVDTTAAAGLSRQEVQQIVRETISEQLQQTGTGQLSEEQIQQTVQETISEQLQQADTGELQAAEMEQLQDRIDRLERQIDRRLAELSRLRGRESNVVVESQDGETVVRSGDNRRALLGRELMATLPFAGFRFGEGGGQFLLGVRGDYRTQPDARFRFIPEAAIGLGGGTSINVLANGAFPVASDYAYPFRPYVGAGAGLISDSGLSGLELALNLLVGAEYPISGGGSAFGEFSTLDIFNTNRLLVGYRIRF